jgi:hypothetical protein
MSEIQDEVNEYFYITLDQLLAPGLPAFFPGRFDEAPLSRPIKSEKAIFFDNEEKI